MRKHSENNPHELMGSGKYSLSVGQPILFAGKEILPKEGIDSDNTYSHEVDNSPQMPISSLGDSACPLELAGLIDRRIEPGKGDQGFRGLKVSNIANFCDECSAGSISYSVNRSNNLQLLNCCGLAEIGKDRGDSIEAFHQVQESGYLLRQDKLLSEAIRGDRAFRRSNYLLSTDRDPSAFAGTFHDIGDSAFFGCFNAACGRELLEEPEQCGGKDISQGFQFREGGLKNSFNLIFSGRDEVRDGFSLSGNIPEVFEVLGEGKLFDGVSVRQEKLCDCKGIFFVSLGLSERQLCEIGDQERIDDDSVDLHGAEEGIEIDVVAACGLHGSSHRREVLGMGFDCFQHLGEACRVHSSGEGELGTPFYIEACGRKGIFGYINTNKQSVQCISSLKEYLSKAGEASQPILHSDKDSEIQSTYYGYGRQGTDSFKGSMTQDKMRSPAFPTSMGKTHLYKLYNTNSM